MGYYGGALAAHNHTTTPGDGGQLSNPAFSGVATETGTPALATDLPTVLMTLALQLIG